MYSWSKISGSILIAFILALLPLPDWALWLRPAWILLVLIYWTMMTPHQVGVGIAWIIGIGADLLQGTTLGEHAFAYTIVTYFVSRFSIRLRMYPLIQQWLSVFIFVTLYQFIIYCVQGFIGNLPSSPLYWLASVTSILVWPWLYFLLRDYNRGLKLA